MAMDQMTPLERLIAYNKGEPVDRLPCVPIVGNTAARVIGVKISRFKSNGKMIIENIHAMLDTVREIGYPVRIPEQKGGVKWLH